jgi:hypothetical protein
MKWIKIISIALTLFSFAAGYYSFNEIRTNEIHSSDDDIFSLNPEELNGVMISTASMIDQLIVLETLENNEKESINDELSLLKAEIEIVNSKIAKFKSTESDKPESNSFLILMAKLAFSSIFCLSALFVVLSKKYNKDTENGRLAF